jgi:hypothetical protein
VRFASFYEAGCLLIRYDRLSSMFPNLGRETVVRALQRR